MFAKDAIRVLGITHSKLVKYVKNGRIRVNVVSSKRYDYNDDDVYKVLKQNIVISMIRHAIDANNKINLEQQCTKDQWFWCFEHRL